MSPHFILTVFLQINAVVVVVILMIHLLDNIDDPSIILIFLMLLKT